MELTAEARARLVLHGLPRGGLVHTWRWIRTLGSARAVASAPRDVLEALGVPPETREDLRSGTAEARADASEQLAARHGIRFRFPKPEWDRGDLGEQALAMEGVDGPPLVLTVRGDEALLDERRLRLAVVGTRTPTPYGSQQARRLSFELAARGFVIVSGFARGVDREAHRAALEAAGSTIAVLGSGILTPYPADDPALYEAIGVKGLIVSEFGLEVAAARSHFPRRNRILSGLSKATLVVEASAASGSLITARWAVDQGREVFVVPGRIDSPMSAGCHELLREGAWLVPSLEELLRDLESLFGAPLLARSGVKLPLDGAGAARPPARPQEAPSDPLGRLVARAGSGATFDELAEVWEGPPDALFEAVVGLELDGVLERGAGGLLRAAVCAGRG